MSSSKRARRRRRHRRRGGPPKPPRRWHGLEGFLGAIGLDRLDGEPGEVEGTFAIRPGSPAQSGVVKLFAWTEATDPFGGGGDDG